MKSVEVNQPVLLPDNRTGIVVSINEENRTAECSVNHRDETVGSGGGAHRGWYSFDELEPLTAMPRREDSVQAARRVVDEATGVRPKTKK